MTNKHLQQTTGPGRKSPVMKRIQTQVLKSSYAEAPTSQLERCSGHAEPHSRCRHRGHPGLWQVLPSRRAGARTGKSGAGARLGSRLAPALQRSRPCHARPGKCQQTLPPAAPGAFSPGQGHRRQQAYPHPAPAAGRGKDAVPTAKEQCFHPVQECC